MSWITELGREALGFPEAECHARAMGNVHARALEGYLVWLQNRGEPQRDRQGREKLAYLLGEASALGFLGSRALLGPV